MNFRISDPVRHIFILGAGSSVEYGLPVWNELSAKIKEKIDSDKENSYEFNNKILSWLDKIGDGRLYTTLDECIFRESNSVEHSSNGLDIENKIFLIVKEILNDSYQENVGGWIKILNQKILNEDVSEEKIEFVNYNYDFVLDDNFLNYEYLTQKDHLMNESRVNFLSRTTVRAFYPHGILFHPNELKRTSYLQKSWQTPKTGKEKLLDAMSCYDVKDFSLYSNYKISRNLYILGLGGGLMLNLSKIDFSSFLISQIHVTIRDKTKRETIVNFLAEKFNKTNEEIWVYDSCVDLIENCF